MRMSRVIPISVSCLVSFFTLPIGDENNDREAP